MPHHPAATAKKGDPADYRLLYVDETHIDTNPGLAKVWQRIGEPTRIPAAGTNVRTSVFSALDYHSGYLTSMLADRASSTEFQAFLEQLLITFPHEQLQLVMDNAAYHKSSAMQQWYRDHPQIHVLLLPPYSPQLNLIERVFRSLKQQLAGHRFWNHRTRLQEITLAILDQTVALFHAPAKDTRPCHNLVRSA